MARLLDQTGRAVPGLVLLFLLALGSAWVFGNPPGAAPDEASHYVKAIGVGGGDLLGSARSVDASSLSKEEYEGLAKLLGNKSDLERVRGLGETTAGRWQQRSAREFTVPAGLGFTGFGCDLTRPERSARCLEDGRRSRTTDKAETFMGTYQPYLYAAPGLLLRSTREPLAALRLGRLATALLSLGLLGAAAFLLWNGSRGALSLTGLIVAVSPSVVFFASTLSTSGPEICAAVCFTASLIRLTRETRSPSWVWLLAGASGAVLALSRSLGPLFIVVALISALALSEPGRIRETLRAGRRAAAGAAALIGLGVAAGLAWQLKYQPSLGWNRQRIVDGIDPAIDDLGELAMQVVGKFGALEADLPLGLYVVWWLMFGALLAVAFAFGGRRERLALAGLSLGVVVLTVCMSAIFRQTDFPLQGRHALPLVVVVPMWAGEVINRHAHRLRRGTARGLLYGFSAAAAGAHALAWYANGRRFAVGVDGGWNFIPNAEWEPPLGWVPWLIVVAAGMAAYVLAGATAARALK